MSICMQSFKYDLNSILVLYMPISEIFLDAVHFLVWYDIATSDKRAEVPCVRMNKIESDKTTSIYNVSTRVLSKK